MVNPNSRTYPSIGSAYVQLMPSMKGFNKSISKQLKSFAGEAGKSVATGLDRELGRQLSRTTNTTFRNFARGAASKLANAGATAGKAFTMALNKAVNVSSTITKTTAGVTAAGTLAGAATVSGLGLTRALSIEDAQQKLRALSYQEKEIASISKSAMDSVLGTVHGFDDAITAAVNSIAAGVEMGAELDNYMSTMVDTAILGQSPLADISRIFNKIQATGKAYTFELLQLSDRGIPVFKYLSEAMGMTQNELRKMVENAELDSDTFFRVLSENIGGVAKIASQTTTGAFRNLKISVARMGEAFYTPALPYAYNMLNNMIKASDALTERLKPLAPLWWDIWGPKIESFDWLEAAEKAINFIKEGEFRVQRLTRGVNKAAQGFSSTNKPLTGMLAELQQASSFWERFDIIYNRTGEWLESLGLSWYGVGSTLGKAVTWLTNVLIPAIGILVTKHIPDLINWLKEVWRTLSEDPIIGKLIDNIQGMLSDPTQLADALKLAGAFILISQTLPAIVASLETMWGLTGLISGGFSKLKGKKALPLAGAAAAPAAGAGAAATRTPSAGYAIGTGLGEAFNKRIDVLTKFASGISKVIKGSVVLTLIFSAIEGTVAAIKRIIDSISPEQATQIGTAWQEALSRVWESMKFAWEAFVEMTEPIAKLFEEIIVFIAEALLGQKSEAEGVMLVIESVATILTAVFTFLGVVFKIIGAILNVIYFIISSVINLMLVGFNLAKAIVALFTGGGIKGALDILTSGGTWFGGFNPGDILNVPGLATGGDVLPKPGGTLVRLAENREAETVVNRALVNRTLSKIEGRLDAETTKGNMTVQMTINPSEGMDETELARKIRRILLKTQKRYATA